MNSQLIGRIVLPDKIVARLNGQGVWECSDKIVETKLNSDFDPRRAIGVGVIMPFGVQATNQGAAVMRGRAEVLIEIPPVEEGELY